MGFGDNSRDNICIRLAQEKDLDKILELDRKVSYEFWEPLYREGYAHTQIGQNPKEFLEQELERDKIYFPECVAQQNKDRLLVACDKNIPVGFISFSKFKQTQLKIDLLAVDGNYRRMGIGKKLIFSARDNFVNISSMFVFVMRFANKNTQKFYEKLGFKNLGVGPRNKFDSLGNSCAQMCYHYRLEI